MQITGFIFVALGIFVVYLGITGKLGSLTDLLKGALSN